MTNMRIFDGHNDVAYRMYERTSEFSIDHFLTGTTSGHIDLSRARKGGLVGGLFALWAPSDGKLDLDVMRGATYDVPLPPTLPVAEARNAIGSQLALLQHLVERSDRAIVVCRSTSEIRASISGGGLAIVLHLEGADALDHDLGYLDHLYSAGLRSLGPVWSRPNIFGHGVPLRFPGSPDTGPGLTEAGKRLVKECNARRILVDVSHLNEAGFWDVAALTDAPLVATHSNAHEVTPSPRNLTDRQLDAIRDSKGLVGVNFAAAYLRADGQMRADTSLDAVVRHLDYLLERLSEDGVAFGSDYDGAVVPDEICGADRLPQLVQRLRSAGYDNELLSKICCENWLSLLSRTIDLPHARATRENTNPVAQPPVGA